MNRRDLLKALLASGIGAATYSATASQLGLVNALSQQNRFDDYKAIVCIFLYGGNDSYNMLVPTDATDYSTYANVRQNLAIAQEDILPLTTSSSLPYNIGLPSSMSSIEQLFQDQQLSFIANVGPLVEPTTKSSILAKTANLPPQLFSHNDQQKLWLKGNNDLSQVTGWAGRMADLLTDVNPQSNLPINLSMSGTNVLQTANQQPMYALTPEGAQMFGGLDPTQMWNDRRISVLDQLIGLNTHKIGQAYSNKLNQARTNALVVDAALRNAPPITTPFNDNRLEDDLNMVAQMISARNELNMQRQVFFVGFGGWDTHDSQVEQHPELLTTLANALSSFNSALKELGLDEQVTTYTASEFGRTLTSNGDGTDHGWAGHQMVMGGAVDGGKIFGQLPSLELNSEDDAGEGRIIPTTSSEQFSASLAKWFGLTDSEIAEVFPQISRFDSTTINLFSS